MLPAPIRWMDGRFVKAARRLLQAAVPAPRRKMGRVVSTCVLGFCLILFATDAGGYTVVETKRRWDGVGITLCWMHFSLDAVELFVLLSFAC